jgi:release factor glutamine methyltransferase
MELSRQPEEQLAGGPITGSLLLAWRRDQLKAGGRPAELDWLLDLAGGVGWQQLQALRRHPHNQLTLAQPLEQLESLWHRHLVSDEPLQYLVGRCPWRDLDLLVASGVLIPRQETEILIDLALHHPPPRSDQRWADLGTGSGCIACALAKAWPGCAGLAVDLSAEALAQAAANLQATGGGDRVKLLQGSWWEPLRPWWGRLALVVANPPYIPTAVWAELEPTVRCHEPALSLDGGADGLGALRLIVAGAPQALAPGGLLLLEHHHDQSARVLELLAESGLQQPTAHSDLEGRWRFASARRAGPDAEVNPARRCNPSS